MRMRLLLNMVKQNYLRHDSKDYIETETQAFKLLFYVLLTSIEEKMITASLSCYFMWLLL